MDAAIFSNAHSFPIAPAGGLFVLIVGLAILSGAALRRWRLVLLYAGLAIAAGALVWFTQRLSAGLPPPSLFAIAALGVAVVLEMAAFVLIMPRLRGAEPQTSYAALAIVGAHFLLMLPAFGPLIVVLGLLCVLNVSLGMMVRAISPSFVWASDGVIKIAIGALMLRMSPLFA